MKKDVITMDTNLNSFTQLLSSVGLGEYASTIFFLIIAFIIWKVARRFIYRIFTVVGFFTMLNFFSPTLFHGCVGLIAQVLNGFLRMLA